MPPLRVGYGMPSRTTTDCIIIGFIVSLVREHFSSPLLQFATHDRNTTFTLVECPGTYHLVQSYSPPTTTSIIIPGKVALDSSYRG